MELVFPQVFAPFVTLMMKELVILSSHVLMLSIFGMVSGMITYLKDHPFSCTNLMDMIDSRSGGKHLCKLTMSFVYSTLWIIWMAHNGIVFG